MGPLGALVISYRLNHNVCLQYLLGRKPPHHIHEMKQRRANDASVGWFLATLKKAHLKKQ